MKFLFGILIVLLGLLQFRLWSGDGSILEVHKYQEHIDELRQEGAVLKARNQALEAEVTDLKSGMEAVEERARRDLGMIRKGETFFQVIEPPDE